MFHDHEIGYQSGICHEWIKPGLSQMILGVRMLNGLMQGYRAHSRTAVKPTAAEIALTFPVGNRAG